MKFWFSSFRHRHIFSLALLFILTCTGSWGCAQVKGEANGYSQLSWETQSFDPVAGDRLQLLPDTEIVRFKPRSLEFQKPLGFYSRIFAELSGQLDVDDPRSDFLSYIEDPINWDPTEQVLTPYVYGGEIGYQHTGTMLTVPGNISIGVQTRLEQAQVGYRTNIGEQAFTSQQPLTLLDGVYSPYLVVQSQPLPWFRFLGDFRMDVLSYDAQGVCRIACSQEPKGETDEIIPSFRGNVILGPWFGTEGFLNIGSGFYSNEEREPSGSTAVERLARSTIYEVGVRSRPWETINLMASVWSAQLASERVFLDQGDTTEKRGPSKRLGINVGSEMKLSDRFSVASQLTWSQAKDRTTGSNIPLAPEWIANITLTSLWGNGWSTSLNTTYIGTRPDEEGSTTTLPASTTMDLTARYQAPISPAKGTLEFSLGILNMTNSIGPSSQFLFDSQLGTNQTPTAELNYFPGQPRMLVGGISWVY